jgi:hypothetical protein
MSVPVSHDGPMTESEMAKRVGPVYSRQALAKMGIAPEATELLTLIVQDQDLYPVFQFEGHSVRRDVIDIVRILAEAADPWTIAVWLRTPMVRDPDRRTFLELLDAGEVSVVATQARDAASRWSGRI